MPAGRPLARKITRMKNGGCRFFTQESENGILAAFHTSSLFDSINKINRGNPEPGRYYADRTPICARSHLCAFSGRIFLLLLPTARQRQ